MKLKNCIKKVCCFYASDWHLTVMLLPYIDSKLKENNNIYMKCENSIEEKMQELLEKLTIKNKEDIMKISWNNMVQEDDIDNKEKIYIVSGKENYIKKTNETIEQYYKNKDTKVKIVNCYEISKDKDLNNIIKENGYTQILNTKGETNIANNM